MKQLRKLSNLGASVTNKKTSEPAPTPTTTTTTTNTPTDNVNIIPTAGLTPRDVKIANVTSEGVTIKYMLPPLCTQNGGAIDVRVLIRPAKLYKTTYELDRTQSANITKKETAFRMKHMQNMGKLDQMAYHMEFVEHNNEMNPLRQDLDKAWQEYATKVKKMCPPPNNYYTEANEVQVAGYGWYAYEGSKPDNVGYVPLLGPHDAMRIDKGTSVLGSKEAGEIRLGGLAPNMFYEVCLVARRREEAITDDGNAWSDVSSTTSFLTGAAPWQMAMEKAGLRELVDRFNEAGYGDMTTWQDLLNNADIKMQLGVDAASETQLREILSKEGIVTPEERAKLDRERGELASVCAQLVAAQKASNTQEGLFSLGDPVVNKKSKKFGVVVVGGATTLSVRWDEGNGDLATMPIDDKVQAKDISMTHFNFFLSHCQAEAQNQVAHLSVLLRDLGAKAWFDMDSERLEARDMVRGIANSDAFLLYLTVGYFDRYFCRLEASVAKALGKTVIIVYESDERHGGVPDYIKLVDKCTNKYPEFRDMLVSTEALPMARRAFQRRAVVDEICKRGGFKSSSSSSGSSGGGNGTTTASVSTSSGNDVNELKRALVDLQMEMNDLKSENQELWAFVRAMKASQ